MASKKLNSLPVAPTYEIKIPHGLRKLDGTLSRRQRVEVAMDALALLRLRSRKITLASVYFDADIPDSGQLHSSLIKGECAVCARGILFLASVDRFDRCDLGSIEDNIDYEVTDRTLAEWGNQAKLIEGAFENGAVGDYSPEVREFYRRHIGNNADRRPLMRAICQNIIDNHGEFKP